MIDKVCNLWTERADFRCIPTTGATSDDGAAVMDSGVALEAAKKFHNIEVDLGMLLASRGNHVHLVRPGVVSFPIQQYQWSGPSLQTIERSGHELCSLVGDAKTLLPRPGCSPDGLKWEDVAKALEFLPDNIIVIQHT